MKHAPGPLLPFVVFTFALGLAAPGRAQVTTATERVEAKEV